MQNFSFFFDLKLVFFRLFLIFVFFWTAEAGVVVNSFLNFQQKWASCSHKIVLGGHYMLFVIFQTFLIRYGISLFIFGIRYSYLVIRYSYALFEVFSRIPLLCAVANNESNAITRSARNRKIHLTKPILASKNHRQGLALSFCGVLNTFWYFLRNYGLLLKMYSMFHH